MAALISRRFEPRRPRLAVGLALLAGVAACADEPARNEAAGGNSLSTQEGIDLNGGVSGEELNPVPEAVDDMVANNSGDAAANETLPPPAIPGETR